MSNLITDGLHTQETKNREQEGEGENREENKGSGGAPSTNATSAPSGWELTSALETHDA